MKYLVLIHVLSAIIGIGPTYIYHVFLRKKQTTEQLRQSFSFLPILEYFPKIGGTIAVLSGITLAIIGNYGSFTQLWLIGSLVLYVIIQIIVIGFATPRIKKVATWLAENKEEDLLPEDIKHHLRMGSNYFWIGSACGLLLFIFMILKPV